MSAPSLREVLTKGFMDVNAINLARADYKQTHKLPEGETAQSLLGGMLTHCQKLQQVLQRRDVSGQIGKDDRLKREYTVLTQAVGVQVGKLQTLIAAMPKGSGTASLTQRQATDLSHSASSRAGRRVELSDAEEPAHAQVLRSALKDLKAGKQKEALAQINALQETSPDVVGRILGKIYELAGKPTKATKPAIAHDRFGSIAFFDYKGNSPQGKVIDIAKRIAAVEAVLGELTESAPPSHRDAASMSTSYRGGDEIALRPPVLPLRHMPSDVKDQGKFMVTVWKDAQQVVKAGAYVNAKGETVLIDTSRSVRGTRAYPDGGPKLVRTGFAGKQAIFVAGEDCLYAAERFARTGKKVAVLNMACNEKAGGGVRSGARAQEEDLFRRTGLVDPLSPDNAIVKRKPAKEYFDGKQGVDYYPLSVKVGPIAAGLYSPNVPVFRAGRDQHYAVLDTPFEVDVLTVAAYRLDSSRPLTATEKANTKEKIRTILEMAYQNGVEIPVLSALGCGAFHNMPEEMAVLFQEVIDQYFPNAFEKIIFAIINDHNAKGKNGNFLPFARHFAQQGHTAIAIVDGAPTLMSREQLGLDDVDEFAGSTAPNADELPGTAASGEGPDPESFIRHFSEKDGYIVFGNKTMAQTDCFRAFHPVSFKFGGQKFKCIEGAYQAGRDLSRIKEFANLDGQAAFDKGRAMGTKQTKPGWFGRNEEHMRNVLFAAYTQNPELKKLLLATGNAYLVEHGPDKFWHNGIDGTGQNKLGELLMELRGKLGGHGIVATAPAAYTRALAQVQRPTDDGEVSMTASSTSRSRTAESPHVTAMRKFARDNGFVAFYDIRDRLTECFGNFHICRMQVGDTSYVCSEAAFQAQKDPLRRAEFSTLDGDGSFQHAKTVTASPDWINTSHVTKGRNIAAMREVLHQKFTQNPYLIELLLATGNAYLIEHIPHDRNPPDAFWGDGHDGTGKNMLGILLMELRGKLGGTGVVTKIPRDMHAKLQRSSLR